MRKLNKKMMVLIIMLCAMIASIGQPLAVQASTKLSTPKITVAKKSESSVAIKWNKVSSAKKYYVYCSENGEEYKKIASTTDKIYIHKKLNLGTKYSYKVKAVAGKKSSKYSNTKSIITGTEGYLLDILQPYDKSTDYRDCSNDSFEMAGDSYTHGFYCSGNDNNIYFNLHGDYSTLSFYVGTVDPGNSSECKVNIYTDDVLASSFVIGSHDVPIKKQIDISNCQKLVINTRSDSGVFCGLFGFGDIKVQL